MTGYLVLLAFSWVITIILHAVLSRGSLRRGKPVSQQVLAIAAFFLGYPVTGVLGWFIYLRGLSGAELLTAVLYGVLVYSGFAYSYFHFFNMSETARRIRILCELQAAGPMSEAAFVQKYEPHSQIPIRLERLAAMGQVDRSGERYVLKSRFLWAVAVVLMSFRKLLKL